ncbi:MAG: 5-oxoprolinase subunit PxpA [Betaproteobacteria bacterium]|nr:5-oxoprolinase subunit PxpA [Betaproteobacteria bacterium]
MNRPDKKVNLNADMGESFGAWNMGDDAALLDIVASANIACGFHAGDPLVMRRTLKLARERGVSIGAHPAYPDLQGFGRRPMTMAPAELEAAVIYQIGALAGLATAEGTHVSHVKPHGALNNTACVDSEVARSVCRAILAVDRQLILLAPALSRLAEAGREAGLTVVEEVFADRAYLDNGQLVPRQRSDAMIHGAAAAFNHVRRMLEESAIVSVNGKRLPTQVESICVHGDGADAVAIARHLKQGLSEIGYAVVTIPALRNKF